MEDLPHVVPINKHRTETLHYAQQLLITRYRLWRQAIAGRQQAVQTSPERDIFITIPGNEENEGKDFYMRVENFLQIMERSVVEAQMFMRLEYVKERRGDKEKEIAKEDPIGAQWSDELLAALSQEPEATDTDLDIGPLPMPEWLNKIVPSSTQDKLQRVRMLALWAELLDKKFVASLRDQKLSIVTEIEEEKGRRRRKSIHVRYNEQTFTMLYACIFSILYEVIDEDPEKLPQMLWEIQRIKENVAGVQSADLQKLIPQRYVIDLPNIVDLRF